MKAPFLETDLYIIAEAGVNHNGDIGLAKKLVDVAKDAGADAVKFQTFRAQDLVTQDAKKAAYQVKNMGSNESQFEMLKALEMTEDMHIKLLDYCREINIDFLSTPFDFKSIDYLSELKIKMYKVPSSELTNKPYIKKIAAMDLPIILSTGMSTLDEIADCISWIKEARSMRADGLLKDVCLLHCTTDYPTKFKDVHLKAMQTLEETFHLPVGYSDHTLGCEVSIAAVTLGARIIEKHITLDCRMKGPDHRASIEPDDFKKMVTQLRHVHIALGHSIKQPTEIEMKNRLVARKSLVAKKSIERGECYSEENITAKRPGSGISPAQWDDVIGQKAKRHFDEDELIEI